MYQDKYQFEKKKKGGIDACRIITVVLLALLLIGFAVFFYIFITNGNINAEENAKETKTAINSTVYTELVGYGPITINSDNEELVFENLYTNENYLTYIVLDEDNETLYETACLAPGEKDSFNVYELLDEGEYTLTYSIFVYSDSFELLNGDITMYQDIIVEESE